MVTELFRRVSGLRFSISYTTRPPRGSEQDGREYFFVDRVRFEAMAAAGEFLEHAEVFGNGYGTAWAFLQESERKGEDLVLDIDVQGAGQVKQRWPSAVSVFIVPPDRDTLARRLRRRGLNAPDDMAQRLGDASREIAAYNRYDYVVINDQLEVSAEQLCAIVRCERSRRSGSAVVDVSACAAAEACRQVRAGLALQTVLASFGVGPAPVG